MNVVRTSDASFEGLEDYDFAPRYVDVDPDGLRMHYVDEGDPTAAPVLMMHGNPTWSYLYRHMIGVCAAAGHRVIAPDLIGFGRSDKPSDLRDYSYRRHVDWVTALIVRLDLRDITLFCQDWGSLIGLRVAVEQEPRFARIVIGNGALPTADATTPRPALHVAAVLAGRAFTSLSPIVPVGRIVDLGCRRTLRAAERRAYGAPFTDSQTTAGVRAFPHLLPITARDPAASDNRAAWAALGRWRKPFLTLFSDGDPITRDWAPIFRSHVPGAAGLPHTTPHAGHFLQEDAGPELAGQINRLIDTTP